MRVTCEPGGEAEGSAARVPSAATSSRDGASTAVRGKAAAAAARETGVVVWFTGLSGSGKTTIAKAVERELRARGRGVELLDGDVVRTNLSKGLGFSKEDRDTNVRRIGFVAHLLSRNGVIVMTAAISPYRAVRDEIRTTVRDFIEVHVDAPLEICEARDPKGLYARARAGELPNFTGIDDAYEPPLNPEVVCHTARESVEQSALKVITELERGGYIASRLQASADHAAFDAERPRFAG